MSIVVTTPTGQIGSRVVRLLIQAGVRPTVIVRDPARLDPAVRDATDVRVADLANADAIIEATKGADTVFWLIPPDYSAPDPVAGSVEKGKVAVRAIQENKIPRVVFLSSIAADVRHGAGLIDGVGQTEELLEATDASIVHLRPGSFFTNLFMQVDGLKRGFFGAPSPADLRAPYVDPRDIGDVAAARLLDSSWTGRHIQGIHGPADLAFDEIATILSDATGRNIAFVEVPDDEFHANLLGAGLPKPFADGYMQMVKNFRSGYVNPQPRTFATTTPTTLGAWAYENLRSKLNSEN